MERINWDGMDITAMRSRCALIGAGYAFMPSNGPALAANHRKTVTAERPKGFPGGESG